MKKTLVALAALAATGAFAQVTVSGKLGFGYYKNGQNAVVGGAPEHGLHMTDGNLTFTATEDLGGGWKATAMSEFVSRGRGNAIAGRDAKLDLVTPVGMLTLGSVESCSRLDNVAGSPVSLPTGIDAALGPLDGCATLDIVAFNAPIGPLTVGVNYSDSIGAAGAGAGAIKATQLTGAYNAGPLMLGLDHTTFQGPTAYRDGLARTRFVASYDLGLAKLGFGHQMLNHDGAPQTSFSVNVPMGAVSLGLSYAVRQAQGASTLAGANAVEGARSGTAIGLKYDLSKQTNLNVSYGTFTADAANQYDSTFRVRLMKSF